MDRSASDVAKALARLQQAVRYPRAAEEPHRGMRMGRIPSDLLGRDGQRGFALTTRDQLDAFADVRRLLLDDPHYEHLNDNASDEAVWRFACRARIQGKGIVKAFVAEHDREPVERTCLFPVEQLAVREEFELGGVPLLPVDSVPVPEPQFFPDPRPTMRSIIAVTCSGTNLDRMRERARVTAEYTLRLLRVALGDRLDPSQLRFRLGEIAWFEDEHVWWGTSPDRAIELDLSRGVFAMAKERTIVSVPPDSGSEIDERVRLALEWIERAQLTTEPLVSLLFLFFAVEAILGDRFDSLKGHNLAVRRAMLSFLTTENETASHPSVLFDLYKHVRSAAVHGEQPPVLAKQEIRGFESDVRMAIEQYLTFARTRGLSARNEVIGALVNDERYEGFVERLRTDDPTRWKDFGR